MRSSHGPAGTRRGWCLYVLQCADGSWYTGITNDLQRRLARHASGTASRYTRGRLPVRLVHLERCRDRSSALRKECRVKALSRPQKQAYVEQRRRAREKPAAG